MSAKTISEDLDTDALRRKWDERHRTASAPRPPAAVLAENLHLLPARGRALDLACGLGANALLLARQGLDVCAWDLSPVAIDQLRRAADAQGLTIDAQVRDIEAHPPEPEGFDVIVVAHFLSRELMPAIGAALRPGGLLYYQTFTQEALSENGPSSERYRFERNELLWVFSDLWVCVYREEGKLGDITQGQRDQAMLIAQQPLPAR
jgi:SAM-dependent methyltransferase